MTNLTPHKCTDAHEIAHYYTIPQPNYAHQLINHSVDVRSRRQDKIKGTKAKKRTILEVCTINIISGKQREEHANDEEFSAPMFITTT